MGTNYYLHIKPPCPCCKRHFDSLHIGKSSGGWCFGLHVIPKKGLNSLDDWMNLWAKKDAEIYNEYDERVSVQEMKMIITNRQSYTTRMPDKKFLTENHGEPGPNGLLRHKIDGRCIGHGEGTWDYIVGEFS